MLETMRNEAAVMQRKVEEVNEQLKAQIAENDTLRAAAQAIVREVQAVQDEISRLQSQKESELASVNATMNAEYSVLMRDKEDVVGQINFFQTKLAQQQDELSARQAATAQQLQTQRELLATQSSLEQHIAVLKQNLAHIQQHATPDINVEQYLQQYSLLTEQSKLELQLTQQEVDAIVTAPAHLRNVAANKARECLDLVQVERVLNKLKLHYFQKMANPE